MKGRLRDVDDQSPGVVGKPDIHPAMIKLLGAPKQIEKLKNRAMRYPE